MRRKTRSFFDKKTVFLLIIIFAGFFLRLGLTILNRSGDVNNHIVWTQYLLKHGPVGFYERNFAEVIDPNYPPFTMFFFILSQLMFQLTQSIVWWLNISVSFFPSNLVFVARERFVLEAFYKLPAIFADMGIVWLVYLFVKSKKKSSSNMPIIAAAIVAFNPAFFYNSAYWGQVESIPIFFILASFYSFLRLDRKVLAIFLVCLAFLSKQTMVVFTPLWFVILMRKYSYKEKMGSIFLSAAVFIVAFLPFHKNTFDVVYPFSTYINKILLASGSTYVTNHAFNIWYIVTRGQRIEDITPIWFGLQYRMWAYGIAFLIVMIVMYWLMKKKKLTSSVIFYGATLLPFITFLLLPRVHERHFEPVLPFLLLLYFSTGRYMRFFIILSFFHFINLYHGWWQPEIPVVFPILKLVFSPLWVLYIFIGVVICICGIILKDFVRYKEINSR